MSEDSTDRIRVRSVGTTAGFLSERSPLLQRIFAARGIANDDGVDTGLDALLPVSSLAGVREAAQLLLLHRERQVMVVGDFDVDGATSTAVMLRALRSWGFAAVNFTVPDRFRFGYGLTTGIVDHVAPQAPSLLVTVDNGISSLEGVARAKALGMDVLITDHHLPGPDLPIADVIVNPNLKGSTFGSRSLAGVGVAFYVLAALRRRLQELEQLPSRALPLAELLDLVALGTVADMVPLDANNRILVAQGLRRIRAGRCVAGIRALLSQAQRDCAQVVASDMGFAVAPRLNAAGRLEDMSLGVRCLISDDAEEVERCAQELDALNRQRREIEADMQGQAREAVRAIDPTLREGRHAGICLYDAGWHQGVVGLVASRVKDRLGRPVVAFAPEEQEGMLRGSARSIPGVHIRDVLEAIATREPGLIERFGGHAMAAGMTLRAAHLDGFARAFEEEVTRWMRDLPTDDVIWTDGELAEADFSLGTAQLLRGASPWGQAFPEPSFVGEFDIESSRIIGERHVKFWLRPAGSSKLRLDAIAFNLLDGETNTVAPSGRARLVFRLDVNHFQGNQRLQLLVDHLESKQRP